MPIICFPLDCGVVLKGKSIAIKMDHSSMKAMRRPTDRPSCFSFIERPFHRNEVAVPIQFTSKYTIRLVIVQHFSQPFSVKRQSKLLCCIKIFCACVKGEITTVKLLQLLRPLARFLLQNEKNTNRKKLRNAISDAKRRVSNQSTDNMLHIW